MACRTKRVGWGHAADRAAATPRWRPGADGQVLSVCWKDAEPSVSGVVRSDLIVCGPSVAPMWPQPVWSEVLGQGAAVTQVLWVRPNTSRFQVFRVAPRRCRTDLRPFYATSHALGRR